MNKLEKAVAWAEAVAADDSHGYDQQNRWGPDYDCSSLVISAFQQAGIGVKTRGATYTGNMRPAFLACGFRDVTGEVVLSTGAGLRRGDVLLNAAHHTALYRGGGQVIQAGGNEWGGVTGGRTGDQTGREIGVCAYYNFPWDCVLRYEEESSSSGDGAPSASRGEEAAGGSVYTVQAGDSLWSVAEKRLGDGMRWRDIYEASGLSDGLIYPGQVLTIPGAGAAGPAESCTPALPVLRQGDRGAAVAAAQTLLLLRQGSLPVWGADGEFGAETAAAVRAFQSGAGMTADAVIGAGLWEALVGTRQP